MQYTFQLSLIVSNIYHVGGNVFMGHTGLSDQWAQSLRTAGSVKLGRKTPTKENILK